MWFRPLIALLLGLDPVQATKVSIDLGFGSFKTALAQAGKEVQVLINEQSKRSTPAALNLYSPPRLVGNAALTLGQKQPYELIELAHAVAGLECSGLEVVPWNTDYHSFKIECDQFANRYRLTVREGKLKLWPEDIIAHFLDHIKGMAEQAIREQSATDAVANAAIKKLEFSIALPVGASYRQQLAYASAARIANVILSPIGHSQLAASAAAHAVDIQVEEGQERSKLLLDIGAFNAQACLVRYQRPKATGVATTGIRTYVEECHHVDTGAGGFHADWVLADFVMGEFEKTNGAIKGSKRDKALKRVLAEVQKKKHVLSTNKSCNMSLENLDGDGHHVKLDVDRDTFERLLEKEGLYSRIVSLVEKFDTPDRSLHSRIEAVEWIGNGWRIPSIQDRVMTRFPDLSYQTTINPSESVILGNLYLHGNDPKYKLPRVYLEDQTNPNVTITLSDLQVRDARSSLERIQNEDRQRAALEQARNDFEDFIYKSRELLENDEKLAPILEEERELIEGQTEEPSGWFGGLFKGDSNNHENDKQPSHETTNDKVDGDEPEKTQEDHDDTNEVDEKQGPEMTIAQRIPKALDIVNEARSWLDSIADQTFDKSKGLKFRDDIRELINPLMDRLKDRKKKLQEERKAKAAEKRAEREAAKQTEATSVDPDSPLPAEEEAGEDQEL